MPIRIYPRGCFPSSAREYNRGKRFNFKRSIDPIRAFPVKKTTPLALITLSFFFFTDASRKLNSVVASMDRICWLIIRKENGFAQRRRRRAWRELDTTGDWPVDTTTFSRMPLLSVSFFFSRRQLGSAQIAVKRLRRDGSLTIPCTICLRAQS